MTNINVDKIEEQVETKLDYDSDYKLRRSQQIISAKLKANKQKRRAQRQQKREEEKMQQEKDKISIELIKDYLKKDIEMEM